MTTLSSRIKCKVPVIVLLFISLVFRLLSFVKYFTEALYFADMLSMVVSLAPIVMLLVYIFKYHHKYKAYALIPIAWGIMVLPMLFPSLFGYYRYVPLEYIVIELPVIVFFILGTINTLKGLPKKIYSIMAIIFGIILQLITHFLYMYWLGIGIVIYENTWYLMLSVASTITFYISLLLFSINNRIPSILSTKANKKSKEQMSPEQALRILKDKLDLSLITEEEYQAKRANIIKKL